jgi:hypothetical protein
MDVKAMAQTALTVIAILGALKLAAKYVPGVKPVRDFVLGG